MSGLACGTCCSAHAAHAAGAVCGARPPTSATATHRLARAVASSAESAGPFPLPQSATPFAVTMRPHMSRTMAWSCASSLTSNSAAPMERVHVAAIAASVFASPGLVCFRYAHARSTRPSRRCHSAQLKDRIASVHRIAGVSCSRALLIACLDIDIVHRVAASRARDCSL